MARKGEGNVAVSEKSLLERVTATAEERHLSQNTLAVYLAYLAETHLGGRGIL